MKITAFTQENCGPCRKLKPKLKDLDQDINFVDIRDNLEAARENQVASTPTVIVEEDGEEINRLVGNKSKEELKKELA